MTERDHWRWRLDPDVVIDVHLSDDERDLLVRGLVQWDGPARPSAAVAALLELSGSDSMAVELRRMGALLREAVPLSHRDWLCALAATELAWASEFHGAASDWESVTGLNDERTLAVLRGLQRRLRTALSVAYTREPQ